MCFSTVARACCCACLVVWGSAQAANAWSADDLRTWTDSSGKHKVEAKFKQVADGKVTLLRKGGAVMEIELKKLSAEDQEYVAARLKEADEDPFKVKSNDEGSADDDAMEPDEEAEGGKPTKAGKGKAASKPPKTVQPDWSKAENIAHGDSGETWKMTVPVAPVGGPNLKARTIPTPLDEDRERSTDTVISPTAAQALVGSVVKGRAGGGGRVTHREFHSRTAGNGSSSQTTTSFSEQHGHAGGDDSSVTKLSLCDLVKGKVLGTGMMPGSYIPVALDEGGARALMREDTFGFDPKALELWELTTAGPKAILRWFPAVMGDKHSDIKWGSFLKDDRVITLDKSGALVIWNAKTGQPAAYLQIGGECEPAFTADRRYLLFGANQTIGVLDVNSTELVAETPSGKLNFACFAFSPDGSKFACSSGSQVSIRDFATGAVVQQIPLAGTTSGREVVWPHEKYLLVDHFHIFDIENQVILWHYVGARASWMAGKFCLFGVNPLFKNTGALVLATVPPPNLEQVLSRAMEAPDFFVLTPETTVKLNVDGLPQAEEREKARAALTGKLEANGCKVGPDGTIELVATVESKPIQQSYRKLGRVPPTQAKIQTYQLQEFTSRVAFIYQGKPAWQVQTVNTPHFVRAKPGQAIEAALHETEKPNYDYFTRVTLPTKLMKPMPEAALGTTRVTNGGLQ